jgi:hypothetical protein
MEKKQTKAHCNRCGPRRNHTVLHSEREHWEDKQDELSGYDAFDTLKCDGCGSITLRHTSWFSLDEDVHTQYYPPAISRRAPEWFDDLVLELDDETDFVADLLNEIYIALQNNLPRLATMGVRALLERVMVSKVEDQGSFLKNMQAFEKLGFLSRLQREHLETVLEAGHATIHRGFTPAKEDVNTLVDVTEHIVLTVYLHGQKIQSLKGKVPPRKRRPI